MTSDEPTSYLPKLIQGVLYAALGVLVIWAIALFMGARDSARVLPGTEQARALARHEIRAKVDEAAKALHEVKWIDQEKGTVHLPIERAMQLAAADLAAKEPRATNVTVAWVAPQMPDYNAPATEAEGPGETEAAAPAAPEAPVSETPGPPTTEAQTQPEAPRLPENQPAPQP